MANKSSWKKKIVSASKQAGTYREYFRPVIETLADILERRDTALHQFKASGAEPMIEHTNKGGSTYLEQNPLLRMVNELNRDALAYWRDLGLTPAGLKKIDENSMKPKKRSALAEALKELGA